MTDREAMQMVLEALEPSMSFAPRKIKEAINALRSRLAEPEEKYTYGTPLLDEFIEKQPDLAKVGEVGVWGEREWRGLTDEEIVSCAEGIIVGGLEFARAIEDKLKERNT